MSGGHDQDYFKLIVEDLLERWSQRQYDDTLQLRLEPEDLEIAIYEEYSSPRFHRTFGNDGAKNQAAVQALVQFYRENYYATGVTPETSPETRPGRRRDFSPEQRARRAEYERQRRARIRAQVLSSGRPVKVNPERAPQTAGRVVRGIIRRHLGDAIRWRRITVQTALKRIQSEIPKRLTNGRGARDRFLPKTVEDLMRVLGGGETRYTREAIENGPTAREADSRRAIRARKDAERAERERAFREGRLAQYNAERRSHITGKSGAKFVSPTLRRFLSGPAIPSAYGESRIVQTEEGYTTLRVDLAGELSELNEDYRRTVQATEASAQAFFASELDRIMHEATALARRLYTHQTMPGDPAIPANARASASAAAGVRGRVNGTTVEIENVEPMAKFLEFGTRSPDIHSFIRHAQRRRTPKARVSTGKTKDILRMQQERTRDYRFYVRRKNPDPSTRDNPRHDPYLIVPVPVDPTTVRLDQPGLPIYKRVGEGSYENPGGHRLPWEGGADPQFGTPLADRRDKRAPDVARRFDYTRQEQNPNARFHGENPDVAARMDPQDLAALRVRRAMGESPPQAKAARRLFADLGPKDKSFDPFSVGYERYGLGGPMSQKQLDAGRQAGLDRGVKLFRVDPQSAYYDRYHEKPGVKAVQRGKGYVVALRFVTLSLNSGAPLPPPAITPFPVMRYVQAFIDREINQLSIRVSGAQGTGAEE